MKRGCALASLSRVCDCERLRGRQLQRGRRRSCSITRPASLVPCTRVSRSFRSLLSRFHADSRVLSSFFLLLPTPLILILSDDSNSSAWHAPRPETQTHTRARVSHQQLRVHLCEFAAKPVKKLTSSIMSQGEKARQHAQLLVLMLAISLLISTRIADVVEAGRQPVTGESRAIISVSRGDSIIERLTLPPFERRPCDSPRIAHVNRCVRAFV